MRYLETFSNKDENNTRIDDFQKNMKVKTKKFEIVNKYKEVGKKIYAF